MPDVYEIVNATQLDSDLEDIADAIRAKSGGQSALDFPNEFISEIGSIPTGASITGETSETKIALQNIAAGDTIGAYSSAKNNCLTRTASVTSGGNYCVKFNPSGTVLAMVGSNSSNRLSLWTPSKTSTFTKITGFAQPAGTGRGCAWSPDGTRLAVAHDATPFITIYDTTTTPYSKIANPSTLPPDNCYDCAWSPDGTRLAVAHNTTPFITIYDTTTIPYTAITSPATLPTGSGRACAWSPDGTRLAVGHISSPYITIYNTTTTPYTKLTNPSTLPAYNVAGCAWSPDGTRLAASHSTSPNITIYDTTTTPYSKITNPSTLPTGAGARCAWSSDGKLLGVAHDSSPYITIYKTESTPYVKITNAGQALYGATSSYGGKGIDFNGIFIAACSSGPSNAYGTIYTIGDYAKKASNSKVTDAKLGYAPGAIAEGASGTVKILFN